MNTIILAQLTLRYVDEMALEVGSAPYVMIGPRGDAFIEYMTQESDMEFEALMTWPSSDRKLLYQQVEEQSDICDVTIQVGQWRKKFHWCVLVESPFFECIRRGNFIEKRKGLAKLNIADPLSTETTILFLYGKKPKLTEENVAAVLELSEFLLIPNLKSACVAFIKHLKITLNNCMKLLQLSSIFDFRLVDCYNFIRGHLQDILQMEEALSLTKESVLALLQDPLLSYVIAEEKFEFAIRWANASRHNYDAIQDIFKVIDLDSIDEEFFRTVVMQHPLVTAIANANLAMYTGDTKHNHRVLVFPEAKTGTRIACFDLESKRWCGIETELPDNSDRHYSITCAPIEGTRGTGEVYRVVKNGLHIQNLNSKVCSIKNIPNVHEDIYSGETFCKYSISKDYFVGLSDGPTRWLQSKGFRKQTTTVYLYQLNQPEAPLCPLFTLRNGNVYSVCINENNLIALYLNISKNRTMYIYDMLNCLLDDISLDCNLGSDRSARYDNCKLASKGDGFIFYNDSVLLIITRLMCQERRYSVRRVDLENHRKQVHYTYTNDKCFRLLERTRYGEKELEFSFASHEELLSVTAQKVEWETLPSPPGCLQRVSEGGGAFMMEFSRSMLRCHFDCPHCKQLEQEEESEEAQQQPVSSQRKTYALANDDAYLYDDPGGYDDFDRHANDYGYGYDYDDNYDFRAQYDDRYERVNYLSD